MFERLRVQTVQRAAELDRMAWLIGSYNTTATNAPNKYPRKPRNADRILHTVIKREPMTDAEMQAVAKSIARRWNEQCRQ